MNSDTLFAKPTFTFERSPTLFTLTEDHIKLLRNAHVQWNFRGTGAPEIDTKRPYGDSDVFSQILYILDRQPDWGNGQWSEAQIVEAEKIHKEIEFALQIVLCCKSFRPGTYRRKSEYDTRTWSRVRINKGMTR